MQKLEDLFKISVGTFDTPKKVNRCSNAVSAEVIRDLEAGKFSHEMLQQLLKKHPVFRYKTCVTIHGNWPEIERERIGSYKNVIQNANGSIEVRYSAIDADKRETIAALIMPSKFRYTETSAGGYFYAQKAINAENYAEVLADFRATIGRIEPLDFYGSANIFRGVDFGTQYLACSISALAIPQQSVEPLAVAIAGQDIATLKAAADTRRAERDAQQAQWKAENDEREVRAAANKAIQQEHAKELRATLAAMPQSSDMSKGILVEVVRSATPTKCLYKFYRLDGKGTFGRIKHSTAVSSTLSTDNLTWKVQNEMKAAEVGDLLSTRLFNAAAIVSKPTPEAKQQQAAMPRQGNRPVLQAMLF